MPGHGPIKVSRWAHDSTKHFEDVLFFNMWGGVSLPRVLIGLYIVEMVHFDSNGRKAKHVHFVSFCPNLLDTVNICRCPAVSEIRAGVTIESKYQNALSSLF